MWKLRALLFIALGFSVDANSQAPQTPQPFAYPAIQSNVPAVFDTDYLGIVGIGMTLQARTRLSGDQVFDPDGNVALTIGLGNPRKSVGISVAVNIYGMTAFRGRPENFGEGTINVTFSRALGDNLFAGAGVKDLTGWRLADPNGLQSFYAALAGRIFLSSPDSIRHRNALFVTAGMGNGRFRTDEHYTLDKSGRWDPFLSLAYNFAPPASFIAEWTGYDLLLAFSLRPIPSEPFNIVFGVDDLTEPRRRWILGLSYGFSLGNSNFPLPSLVPPPPAPQSSRI